MEAECSAAQAAAFRMMALTGSNLDRPNGLAAPELEPPLLPGWLHLAVIRKVLTKEFPSIQELRRHDGNLGTRVQIRLYPADPHRRFEPPEFEWPRCSCAWQEPFEGFRPERV